MFSSKSFIVSGLTFRSLIHFSLFLCMMLESILVFFLLCVGEQFSQHPIRYNLISISQVKKLRHSKFK